MKTIHFTADLHHSHPKIVDICNRPVYMDQKVVAGLKEKNSKIENYDIYKDKEYLQL